MPRMSARCPLPPPGWTCSRPAPHGGPCAASPAWWNLRGHDRVRRATGETTILRWLLAVAAVAVLVGLVALACTAAAVDGVRSAW